MFVDRKPIPFLFKGPDPTRFYARDVKRWSIFGGECKKDGFKAKVELNSGWGLRETLSSVAVPIFGCLLFGTICLWIWFSNPQQENVGQSFLIIVGICLLQVPFFTMMVWLEASFFSRFPSDVLTVFDNREFSINGEKVRYSLPPESVLRYSIHYPEPDSMGAGTHSELDLVIRDGDKEIAVHKLMAFQYSWCWKPAKKLSSLSGIPLVRVARQSDGSRFPPALPN